MNINELEQSWAQMHRQGLEQRKEQDIQKIIDFGTTKVVADINRKLWRDMIVTGVATLVSALGIIFFYTIYDPAQHTWIDVSKLFPIQLLAFILFSVMFVFDWLEYKLVNQSFTAQSVEAHISRLLNTSQRYFKLSTGIILIMLLFTFYFELDFFVKQKGIKSLILKILGSISITVIAYISIKQYYKKHFAAYLADLASYKEALED